MLGERRDVLGAWDDREGGGDISSYDEESRRLWQRRADHPGGDGPGGFDHGIRLILIFIAIAFAFVVGKLVWLQALDPDHLAARAEENRTNAITLFAKRGTIYDRNGNVLAISVECRDYFCNAQEVTNPSEAANILSGHLKSSRAEILKALMSGETFVYLERQVDEHEGEKIDAELEAAGIKGVYHLRSSKRDYPYGDCAGQILGAVGIDGEGLSGLEAYYDDILTGKDGEMLIETGVGGTPIAGAASRTIEPVNGTDIIISLDIDVQKVAEQEIAKSVELYEADSGSVMVTDPRNGEIIACCSTPLMNPLDFPEVEVDSLAVKPVATSYEPGSIFKLLTSAIALEEGVVTPDQAFSVPPEVQVGDDYVVDDDLRPYTMVMDLTEMLRRSSNTGLALIAQDYIGAERFAAGVDKFGIGHMTGIDFPDEAEGIVRPLEDWDGSTLGSMAFGQGLAIPMVQMVRAVGAIANGGVPHTPHFLISAGGQEKEWDQGEQVMSQKTCDQVIEMMRGVIREGTAMNAQVPGYDIAGKTGTGQQSSEEGGYKENSFVASLIGFAPAYNADVLVYVGLNGTPYLASESAAFAFSTIMGEALTDMGIQPTV